ncbi:(deoxy)nucleoside triphosphate pyrophosphohydrolase [Desnuesiella massiliensis]|uniref:(deoxy)nucleoside triphosphate pyrophosphohydrolase n=1 Tax=Desnuesiella massiliensis TaxID=1650662 RepID=UPI0006E124C3|nr:(deoxy)nucleoside triphosphate pyrophosphohydrolase [Desnuesiella massiliensis]
MIDVVAAIIENGSGEILIARRKQEKQLGGFWEFPGGKVDKGEKPEESLVRELKEEMDVLIEVKEFFGENIHQYDRGIIKLIAFKCKIMSGTIKLVDHDNCVWVRREQLDSYNFAPADVPFVERLKEKFL